jgi:vancomycin permeability regulator SanA
MDKPGWNEKPSGWEDTHRHYRLQYHPTDEVKIGIEPLDLIIIMAGGLDDNGDLYPWVKQRLDQAISMFKRKPTLILCTGGGTYHKPPILNEEKYVIHESTACAEYLIANGVDPAHIIREWASYDTIASVYFSLLWCVLPRQLKSICVITSEFHMGRTKKLFQWIFGIHGDYQFVFIAVNNGSMPESILRVRQKRERASLESILTKAEEITTKEQFNQWLFTEHKAYSCTYLNGDKDVIPDSEKESY